MKFFLAPMEDHTDAAFRTLCYRHGADATFTEMAHFSALSRELPASLGRISIRDSTPTYIQLVGADEAELKKFISAYEPEPGFLGFNFNLGCPAPELIKAGLGCAMMKRVSKVNRMVGIVKAAGYSCSLKIRLGMNAFEKQRKVYLNLIKNVDADFFVVHARHGSQTYANNADFSIYPECVATGKRIIANGDISTREQVDSLKLVGVNGVMIGRLATADPGIFSRLKGIPTPSVPQLKVEYRELAARYATPPRYVQNITKRMDGLATSGKVQG